MVSSVFVIVTLQLFFFSSRRRHTRSLCDWSSDVCFSDLSGAARVGGDVDVRPVPWQRDDRVILERGSVIAQRAIAGDEQIHPGIEQVSCIAAGDKFERSEEHTSELQSHSDLVCRLLLEKK